MKIKTMYIKLIFTLLFGFNLNAQHLSFDGTNDYVELGDVLDQNSSFSVSAWVYDEAANAPIAFVSKHILNPYENAPWFKYYGFYLVREDSQNIKFVIKNDLAGHGSGCPCGFSVEVSATAIFNQWYYVTAVFESGSNIKLYINGSLAGTTSTSASSINDHAVPLRIGANTQYPSDYNNSTPNSYWNGKLDEVEWNQAKQRATRKRKQVKTSPRHHWINTKIFCRSQR